MKPRTVRRGPAERLPIDERSPWWAEHVSRYVFASHHVRGKRVLDIASGTGYGTAVLAHTGATIAVGGDLSIHAALESHRTFGEPSVGFVATSATVLPFREQAFDAVVTLETIEHVHDGASFVAELRRVLRPGGTLVLSTPNEDVTRHYRRNPFHVREYTSSSLRDLLSTHFDVRILGQRLSSRYHIAPFLPGRDRPSRGADGARLLVWKLANRLPFRMKETLARVTLSRSFYPAVGDYEFGEALADAHVLVALGEAR